MSGDDTGLDLESFLLLLRADLGTWALLGLGTLALGLLVWVSWGSRRALQRCVALSIVAHAGLGLYGSTMPSLFRTPRARPRDASEHLQRIRVTPVSASDPDSKGLPETRSLGQSAEPGPKSTTTPIDLATAPIQLADARQSSDRPRELLDTDPRDIIPLAALPRDPLGHATATPSTSLPASATAPELRPSDSASIDPAAASPPVSLTPVQGEVQDYAPEVEKRKAVQPEIRSTVPASALAALPSTDLRQERPRTERSVTAGPSTPATAPSPLPIARATPTTVAPAASSSAPLADLKGRNLTEVPLIYRSRLDENRSALAQRSGASTASEQAVERALDWLARHQDSDGRWDGGTARFDDGGAVPGDDDFTVHCPPGQTCFGECAYWEADTALTGLALLAYLGAGYTHKEGRFASNVSGGLEFLLASQRADGDLRGPSKAVGIYCHAMATLALCEAYAISLDEKLRDPAERAIRFLERSRARDGQAWRYLPGAPMGDTSILGWVVMSFKTSREAGLSGIDHAGINQGVLLWLDRVAAGKDRGLGCYQPGEPVTPTMTAEAWVCRQFLGTGGPGAPSTEAAEYLLKHDSDKGNTNFYYWYYGTLAMYQHGGPPWTRWNARVRDRIVELQRKSGHISGSWDPDHSIYGARGGRLYCTALGALTLEVYYRYLRLYDKPNLPEETNDPKTPGITLDAPVGG